MLSLHKRPCVNLIFKDSPDGHDAYCRDISIKIRSHLEVKRKNGDYIGAFTPYGYLKDGQDKNRLVRRGMLSLHKRPCVNLIFKDSPDGHGAPFCLPMRLEIVLYTDSKTVLIFHRG